MSQQINLFNPALLPKRELFSARNVAIGAGASLFLIIAGALAGNLLLHRHQQEHDVAQAELTTIQERVTALAQQASSQKPSPAIQSELERTQSVIAARQSALAVLGAISTSNNGAAGFSEYLRGLARQSVNGLWLNKVVIGSKSGDMQIKGRTIDRALVADYVERLNSEKTFAGHGFTGLEMTQSQAPVAATPGATVSGAPSSAPRSAPYIDFELTSTPVGELKADGQDPKSDKKS
jgi:hypothetical protein